MVGQFRRMFAQRPAALIAAMLAFASPALAAEIDTRPASDHPGASIHVVGRDFAGSETVDIYFDGIDALKVAADANGAFKTKLTVPKDALPGKHRIKAVGQTGDAAKTRFTVNTDWSQFRFAASKQASTLSKTCSPPAMSPASRKPGPAPRAATSIHPRPW